MTQRRRLFSPDSFWNAPIPPDPEVDPRSEHYIGHWEKEPTGGLHINANSFAVPVYDVDASTPLRTVAQRPTSPEAQARSVTRRCEFRHGESFPERVPIPDHAIPDPAGDNHIGLVDWERGLAWDMWGALKLEDGSWQSYTGMHYSIDGPGVFKTSDFDVENGDSIHYHGPGRASGVPVIAGLAMRHEIASGRIEHKLSFAARYNGYQRFTFPAAWTDGRYVDGLPEGAVVQLDPDLDLDRFELTDAGRVICRALQEYGMVNVDGAAGTPVYVEGLYGDPEHSWDGLLDENELKQIPVRHFRVLKMDSITPMGDGRKGLRLELPSD